MRSISALLRLPPDPFTSGRDRSFLAHANGSGRNFGVYPKAYPRGIAIGDRAHHWTLCHDAALLHAGLGGRSNSPWPNDSLLAPGPHCTRDTRVKKNIRQPREMVNDRSSIHLFPTVVPCGRNPPPGPPYAKLNCRHFSQDEQVFIHDRSRLDKPERNEIRCGI